MSTIKAYAATAPKAPLQPFEYEPGPLGDEQVEIAVDYCGVCHLATKTGSLGSPKVISS